MNVKEEIFAIQLINIQRSARQVPCVKQ